MRLNDLRTGGPRIGVFGYRKATFLSSSSPLQLSGLRRLLEKMDWPEAVEPFVTFGAVGADEVDAGDDVFLLLGPQNIVGESFAPPPATWTDTPMHTHTDTRRGK